MSEEERFPVVRVSDLAREEGEVRWLIEDLWGHRAVGLIGGAPKSFKSWLALEMAVSVASATPCLGRFAIEEPGPALVYLAEDSIPAVRQRIQALANRHQADLDALDVHVITVPSMRVDLARDQVRLMKTVRDIQPRILVLDPLVRIHRIDENSSADVSGFLAYLRGLQRELDVAIVLVHHTRKNLAPSQAPGQGLRGSGDFHAWSDSGLYLRRARSGDVRVTIEHRAAPSPKPIGLCLETEPHPYLRLVEGSEERNEDDLSQRICDTLAASGPLTRALLRRQLAVQNARLGRELERLRDAQRIQRNRHGWFVPRTQTVPRSLLKGCTGTERLPDILGEANAGSAGEQPAEE